jgi:hypothetical protein
MSHFNVAVFSHSPDEVDALLAPFIEQVEPYSPYAVFEEDEDYEVDAATGKQGHWYNPNARWDWYCVGGRWRGQLKLLEGKTGRYGSDCTSDEQEMLPKGRCDSARVQDCDFSQDEEAYKKALPHMIESAKNDACTATNPRPVTDADVKRIIERIK